VVPPQRIGASVTQGLPPQRDRLSIVPIQLYARPGKKCGLISFHGGMGGLLARGSTSDAQTKSASSNSNGCKKASPRKFAIDHHQFSWRVAPLEQLRNERAAVVRESANLHREL
jgi:hypothetical protein